MPKLSDSRINQGHAVMTLLRLYSQEQGFVAELAALQQPYKALITRFLREVLRFFAKKGNPSPAEYYQAVANFTKGIAKDPFPYGKMPYVLRLQPYFDGLQEIASKWKMRAPWSVPMLFYYFNMVTFFNGFTYKTNELPLEQLEHLYPWPPPAPPLQITIPAWTFFLVDRKTLQEIIANRLREYEAKLKASGLREPPSSLQNHARWWFEHYVHGKTYGTIEQAESSANAESIKRAVWKYTKLVGIKIK